MTGPGHGPIAGLLFDKDGTLFDFAATWAAVTDAELAALAPDPGTLREMAYAVGYDPATRRFVPGSAVVAGTLDEVAAIWARFRPDLGQRRIAAEIERIAAKLVAGGALVPVVPDMAGFLDGLAAQGYRLGVATNDTEDAARQQLGLAGVLACFDFVAGADSGHGAKPGPGMLLAFAAATGIEPGRIAVVGDSVHDFALARAGGAGLSVAVLTGPAGRDELEGVADRVIETIGGLPALLAEGNWAKGDTG